MKSYEQVRQSPTPPFISPHSFVSSHAHTSLSPHSFISLVKKWIITIAETFTSATWERPICVITYGQILEGLIFIFFFFCFFLASVISEQELRYSFARWCELAGTETCEVAKGGRQTGSLRIKENARLVTAMARWTLRGQLCVTRPKRYKTTNISSTKVIVLLPIGLAGASSITPRYRCDLSIITPTGFRLQTAEVVCLGIVLNIFPCVVLQEKLAFHHPLFPVVSGYRGLTRCSLFVLFCSLRWKLPF